ncbi:MAG: hypothetical protein K2X72_05505 [Reyranella sp.]|nr:hypothetical protein [Reyranella sp.]
MNVARRAIFGLPCILLADGACRAQGSTDVWATWAASPLEILGPHEANGALVYLHAEGLADQPVPLIFAELAKAAKWDVLAINRRPLVDVETNDEALLQFIASQIDRVRRIGYARVVVAGISRGGWLALSAAALPAVDAVIGLAPASPGEQERTGHALARRLPDVKTRRIAAFFLAEGLDDGAAGHGAAALRRALPSTGSSFMIVDSPPDLHGRQGASSGRFVRRYRDCLLDFVQAVGSRGGEVPCSPLAGYAVGAEIGFPPLDPALQKMPANADPAFGPFWGGWQGDDEDGNYMTLRAVGVGVEGIFLRIGISDGPGRSNAYPRISRDLAFQLDGSRTRIYYKLFEARPDMFVVKVKSESELEFIGHGSGQRRVRNYNIRLHRSVNADAGR